MKKVKNPRYPARATRVSDRDGVVVDGFYRLVAECSSRVYRTGVVCQRIGPGFDIHIWNILAPSR
jgi:hypothetical protein